MVMRHMKCGASHIGINAVFMLVSDPAQRRLIIVKQLDPCVLYKIIHRTALGHLPQGPADHRGNRALDLAQELRPRVFAS